MSRLRVRCALSLVLCALLPAGLGAAQAPRFSEVGIVGAALTAEGTPVAPGPGPVAHQPPRQPRDRKTSVRLWTARSLIVAGAGLALGGVIGGAYIGRSRYCHDEGVGYVKSARVAGAVVGGLGVSLAVTGTGLYLAVPRDERRSRRVAPGLTAAAVGATLLVAGASTLLVFLASLSDWLGCVSS